MVDTFFSLVIFHWEMCKPWQLLPSTRVHFLTAWERDDSNASPFRAKGFLTSFPHCWHEGGIPSSHPIRADAQTTDPLLPAAWLLSSISPDCLMQRPLSYRFLWTSEGDPKVLQIAQQTSSDRPLVFNLSFLIGISTQWAN